MEYNPSMAYSGAMYPLSRIKRKYKFNKSWNTTCNIYRTQFWKLKECTYYDPTILAVLVPFSLPAKILAIPKSEIFGFMSESNNTLLGFRSLWMILRQESSCKYEMPRAIPLMMLRRVFQSNWALVVESDNEVNKLNSR